MAAPMSVSAASSISCYFHHQTVSDEECHVITKLRWRKIVACSKQWLDLEGREKDIALSLQHLLDLSFDDVIRIHPELGFHDACYCRYTDIKKITLAQKKCEKTLKSSLEPPKKPRRSRDGPVSSNPVLPAVCIICSKVDSFVIKNENRVRDRLSKAETKDAGNLRAAALLKKDEKILLQIRDQDCVAIEVRYHADCYKKYTRVIRKRQYSLGDKPGVMDKFQTYINGYTAFCESVVQQRLLVNKEIIRMSKMTQLVIRAIEHVDGVEPEGIRNDTLKRRLGKDYPCLVFHKPLRVNESELVYCSEVSPGNVADSMPHLETYSTASSILDSDDDEDIFHPAAPVHTDVERTLYMAGIMVKNAIKEAPGMTTPWPPTADDLLTEIQKMENFVPYHLFNLIAVCVGATQEPPLSTYADVDKDAYQKIVSISQDIMYLASKGRKQTPKSLALGLTVRHLTGSSHLLNIIHHFGHCASSDTIRMYETSLALLRLSTNNQIPKGFSPGKLITLIWDNIDFREETQSGHGTTHHTNGIMVQKEQLHPSMLSRPAVRKGFRSLKPDRPIIADYHRVQRQGPQFNTNLSRIHIAKWEHFIQRATKNDFLYILSRLNDAQQPGWTGFNIRHQSQGQTLEKSAIFYLPVIEASPTEMNTVKEIVDRSLEMADKFHLEQIVVVFDQAIYAKVQEIRWSSDYFKQRLVVRLGEFHTAMSFMSIIGKRFGDAGLRDIVIESGIVAEGSINGVLSGHHYNRSIYAVKVMFEAFQRLRFGSFIESLSIEEVEFFKDVLNFRKEETVWESPKLDDLLIKYNEFIKIRREADPTFELWSTFIEMASLLLIFVRATRESDWELHIAVVRLMMPWYFAYDRTNYARYLPAYWMEMLELKTTHPAVFQDLSQRGSWTVQRQRNNAFSSIACDQAIEETLNRDCKTPGGIKGITLHRGAVQRWILAQPERAAIMKECEAMSGYLEEERVSKEFDPPRIDRLETAVTSVMFTVESMINPFDTNSSNLLALSSGVIASEAVKNDLLNAKIKGEDATVKFLKERLLEKTEDFYVKIKQQKLKTFACNTTSTCEKKIGKEMIQNSKAFFSRLLVVGQKRNINLPEVFKYSLGKVSFPLANANGTLAKTDKSSLVRTLENRCKEVTVSKVPHGSALMIDAMAHLQAMRDIPETFGDYAYAVLSQIINMGLTNNCVRVDFVCDTYPQGSIKDLERARRAGKGAEIIKIYGSEQKTPRQFKKYLSDGKNKEDLVEYLFQSWTTTQVTTNMKLLVTHGKYCHELTWKEGCCHVKECSILESDHEEADTRLLLHAKQAGQDHHSIVIKSPDTDVAILALSHQDCIQNDLFFWTGTRNNRRILNLKKMCEQLGLELCKALIGLHTFTGCDSTSAFYGKGKKKALQIVESQPQFKTMFSKLGSDFQPADGLLESLEEFVCELYGQPGKDINQVRYKSFCSSTASEQGLPPCKNALIEHIKRCNYQAAIHWRALDPYICAPPPDGHGWTVNEGVISIVWMTQPSAPESLIQSVSCKCKVGKCLQARCSCQKQDLPCTDMCKCVTCDNTTPSIQSDDYLADDPGDQSDESDILD